MMCSRPLLVCTSANWCLRRRGMVHSAGAAYIQSGGWSYSLLRRVPKASESPGSPLCAQPFCHSGETGESLHMITEGKTIHSASRQNGATLIGRRVPCLWIRTDAELTVITISGEIAASDIDDLSPYARGLIRDCGVLIVDLSGSDFVAVDGLCALLALWSAESAAIERPRLREVRICSERLTVVLRRG
jgi:hypothetical protein